MPADVGQQLDAAVLRTHEHAPLAFLRQGVVVTDLGYGQLVRQIARSVLEDEFLFAAEQILVEVAGYGKLRARALQSFKRDAQVRHADAGRVEAAFTFFLRKKAPVSGISSLLDYQGRWVAERQGGVTSLWAEVSVPVKSLCPCSKEISDYGAHNQRSMVTIRAELKSPIEWHELVRFAEENASSELWPLLKRADEKWVTEHAYENPKFVEDLVRDVALAVDRDPRVGRYSIDVENFESIHNHSAFARIERA